jgi:hypothetical protein
VLLMRGNLRDGTMAQKTLPPPARAERVEPREQPSRARRLAYRLFQPVDGASLAVFRMLFGAIMLVEVWRYFTNDWIARYFIDPTFHFTYFGFGWVKPWAGVGMYVHFAVLGILAACIMLGLAYRIASSPHIGCGRWTPCWPSRAGNPPCRPGRSGCFAPRSPSSS